jgi:hypothetical protein
MLLKINIVVLPVQVFLIIISVCLIIDFISSNAKP